MTRYTDLYNVDKILLDIDKNKSNYCIIHYSCENFFQTNVSTSARITAIAIQNFSNSQTEVFSIQKQVELNKIPLDQIDKKYDMLEKKMLQEYFEYVKHHNNMTFIHWNMRDSNFGFSALNHRYKYLKGSPIDIPDNRKLDLSRLLKTRYGNNYCDNPKMMQLSILNNNLPQRMLSGEEEAEAFKNNDFVKISFSTAAKVDFLCDVLMRTINNELKTKIPNCKVFANSLLSKLYVISKTKRFKVIWWLITVAGSAIISHIVTKKFFG